MAHQAYLWRPLAPLAGRRSLAALIPGALALAALLSSTGAQARIDSARYHPAHGVLPATLPPSSSIVVDVGSGRVLSSDAPDALRHPASLTKMMTLYMLFEALRDRRITLDQPVPVSVHAASVEPSKLGLVPGSHMTVEQGILGLVTKSANDAAAALGELLGGDEARFAQMMTLRARALGMGNTTFRNASGLPDPEQFSTARDLALLARHLVQDFPAEYRYFSVPSYVFHGQTIYNHDRMLITYPGADGLKTGYTEASGHNLVTSALHGDVRLVGVVLGSPSNPQRDVQMAALLNAGFLDENAPPVGPTSRMVASRGLMARLPSLVATAEAEPVPGFAPTRHGAKLTPLLTRYMTAGWAVQLGSFASRPAAQRAAVSARRGADGGALHIAAAGGVVRGKTLWRVQLTGLTQAQAQAACSASIRQHAACMMIRPEPQLASR